MSKTELDGLIGEFAGNTTFWAKLGIPDPSAATAAAAAKVASDLAVSTAAAASNEIKAVGVADASTTTDALST